MFCWGTRILHVLLGSHEAEPVHNESGHLSQRPETQGDEYVDAVVELDVDELQIEGEEDEPYEEAGENL